MTRINAALQNMIDDGFDEGVRPLRIGVSDAALQRHEHIRFLTRHDTIRKNFAAHAQRLIGADEAIGGKIVGKAHQGAGVHRKLRGKPPI